MGNATIKLGRLDPETVEGVLRSYLVEVLSDPSYELFNDTLEQGASAFEAAGHAMFNECTIDILKQKINLIDEELLDKIKNECEHDWEDVGHGHNYTCYKCRKCGKEKDV